MGIQALALGFSSGFGSAFLAYILERLASFSVIAWREISIIWGVEDNLRLLQRTFFKIQDLVDHANGDPLMLLERSNAWLLWFVEMRKLAYDADALLDHVSLHLSIHCSENEITSDQEEQEVLSMIISSLTEFELPRKIQDMIGKLDDLAQEMEYLIKIEKFKSGRLSDNRRIHSSPSSCLVGRASDIQFISDFLSKTCENSNFSAIAIMGMCGIGKTALAHHVYDTENFELKLWVSVSADFDLIRVTRSIVEYKTLCTCSLSDLESLQKMLKDMLEGKKFLLVLDDYWNEKGNDWNILSWPFRFGSQGSKVIVTTSSTRVSSAVCCAEKCTLEILSDDDCWEIIKQTATTSVESLESIGQQIAKKCKGLPLVANMFGNALRCGSSEEEWRYVLENELWDISEDSSMFLHLMQSYVYLPAHLQNCFAYCSIFPQNYEFEMEDLILLWVAEGFVQPKGARTLEDIAKGYFKELQFRFFFQECRNSNNEVRYKMHDLLHDVARLVYGDICFHWKHDGSNRYPLFGSSCHLCLFHDSTQPLELKASVKNERLRTFIVLGGVDTILDSDLFEQLKYMKVLGLASAHLHVLVDSIGALKFLRYLNLSNNPIESLPSPLYELVGLEILK